MSVLPLSEDAQPKEQCDKTFSSFTVFAVHYFRSFIRLLAEKRNSNIAKKKDFYHIFKQSTDDEFLLLISRKLLDLIFMYAERMERVKFIEKSFNVCSLKTTNFDVHYHFNYASKSYCN